MQDKLNYGVVRMLDCEVYKNFFCICIDNPDRWFFSPQEFLAYLWECGYNESNPCTLVTFNGLSFDFPLMQHAYKYFVNPISDRQTRSEVLLEIKRFSDQLINDEKVFRERLGLPTGVRHIDLKVVSPINCSLKLFGARLGCESIQDLPYHHEKVLTLEEVHNVLLYCLHDLQITRMLWEDRKPVLDIRDWSQKNLSDAQIAERAMVPEKRRTKNVVPRQVEVFGYTFDINPENGSPIDPGMPEQVIDGVTFQVGLGGLHSVDSPCVIDLRGREDWLMLGVDVTGFYPSLLVGPLSHLMDETQLELYKGVRRDRTIAKNETARFKELLNANPTNSELKHLYEDWSAKNDMGKLKGNGYFGKTGSRFSGAYNPAAMLSVTLLGQIYLLKLIRMLVEDKSKKIKILSANTDGVEVMLPAESVEHFRAVCKQWEQETTMGLEEERTFFVARRDVNSYVMLLDSKKKPVKTKGIFEPTSIKKSLNFEIIYDAVMASFGLDRKGEIQKIDVRNYIQIASTRHEDFQKFLSVRSVTGGGVINPQFETKDDWVNIEHGVWECNPTGKKPKRVKRVSKPKPYEVFVGGESVGRVIRWYIGIGGKNVYTPKGNKVAQTDNAVLVQDFRNMPKEKIDIEWYIAQAEKLRAALLGGEDFNDEIGED